ncbi:uncharacterized protein LOC143033843 [Oratosquilla oratoria]|uniref:uncharacterized protein LOC143033843 n=1 Tax=Oratosquilla oratoria TaxID=337810 RepID=UPI003F760AFF
MRTLILLVGALSLCSGQHGVPLPPLTHTDTTANTNPATSTLQEPLPTVAHQGIPLIPYDVISNEIDTKTPLLGTVRPVSVNDPDVRRLALGELVRSRTQKDTGSDSAVKISDIISAHKQVVSGQIVYLTLRVHETLCPVGVPDLTNCHIDETEDPHLCEIAVWERSWLNSSKIVDEKTRCAEIEDDNDFDAWRDYNKPHTPVTFSGHQSVIQELPDGLDEEQLAFEAFNYVNVGSKSKFRGHFVDHSIEQIVFDPVLNVTSVRMNVEYGFTLCLKSLDNQIDGRECMPDINRDHYVCGVTIIDNPNEIIRLQVIPDDDDDILCKRKVPVEEELVIPVQVPCLGCPQPAPMSDPTILEVADFALKEYDRLSDDEELHMIVRLIKAQTQVVAGIKYLLTVEIVDTDCHKTNVGVDVNRTFCQQDPTDTSDICDLHVVEQSWVPSKDLVHFQCYDRDEYPGLSKDLRGEIPPTSKDEFIVPVVLGTGLRAPVDGNNNNRPLLGGERPAVIDEKVLEIAEIVVEEYDRREDDDNYHKIVKVHQVSSQVVAGTKYRFVVEIGETHCHKYDPTFISRDNCRLDPTEEHEMCIAEVHEQPWLDTPDSRRILSLYCDDLDDYLRKVASPHLSHFQEVDHPFLNGQGTPLSSAQQQGVSDPKVNEAASFVVDQYNLKEDDDNLYILKKVISAQMNNAQDGSRYMIEVELAETYCKKYLPIADPSRCRIDHNEDQEVCQAEVFVPATAGEKQLVKLYCDEADDYYIRKFATLPAGAPTLPTNLAGNWMAADINMPEVKHLAIVVANEFDLRSDEDKLFKLHKLVNAKQQVQNGMNYHLVVELAETVCPKYKPGINKTSCAVRFGEEHKICEATVWVQSWKGKREVTDMRCADQDDFYDDDESHERLYPSVHPTAHARPIYYKHFRDNSKESRESEEYGRSRSSNRSNQRFDSEEDDSDERLFSGALFRRNSAKNHRRRWRRAGGIPGGIGDETVPAEVALELAQFGIDSVDSLSEDTRRRRVEEVTEIRSQVVAGKLWHLTVQVTWTTCNKGDETLLSNCEPDKAKPKYTCKLKILEQMWNDFRKVTESSCTPVTQKA